MRTNIRVTAAALVAGLGLAACGSAPYDTSSPGTTVSSSGPGALRSGYGTVESVQVVPRNDPSLAGTVIGGLVGGALGSQVGSGRGQTAATIAGAVGGAYAGSQIERNRQGPDVYKVSVRMSDGSYQTYTMESDPGLRGGDRVRIDNGVISRY